MLKFFQQVEHHQRRYPLVAGRHLMYIEGPVARSCRGDVIALHAVKIRLVVESAMGLQSAHHGGSERTLVKGARAL